MKMKQNTDWTDALRDTLRDAEIAPSEEGWERLSRELAAADSAAERASAAGSVHGAASEKPQKLAGTGRRSGSPRMSSSPDAKSPNAGTAAPGGKSVWKIYGPRIAAAAAAVLICVVAGEILWRPDKELGEKLPVVASLNGAGDSAVGMSQHSDSGEGLLAGSGSDSDDRTLRESLAEASGWAQGPSENTAAGKGPEIRGAVSAGAAEVAQVRPKVAESGPEPVAAAIVGTAEKGGAAEKDPEAPASVSGGAEECTAAGKTAAAGRPDEGVANASAASETAADSSTDRSAGNPADRSAADDEDRSAADAVTRTAARRAARSGTSLSEPADDLYAWASEEPAESRNRNPRASFSLFAAGGTSSGSSMQGPKPLSDMAMGESSTAIIGNGTTLGPLLPRDYDKSSFRHHLPLSFGLAFTVEFPYGLSLESGVNYTLLRSDVRLNYPSDEISQTLHFIGVPLRLNWQFVERGRFSAYLGGGGMLEKCVQARLGGKTVDESALQWSLLAALGAQYRLGEMVGLYFEPEVSYYLTDTKLQTSRSDAPLTLTLRLGVRLLF